MARSGDSPVMHIRVKEAVNKVTYTKEQIIGSKKYAGRADLLSALLEPGKSYTLEEVDKKMEKYMKGAVR